MRLSHSDLKGLAVFRAVAEHRGFAGAQVALNLSQSAISFHIKAIEERLGFRVCQRGRTGFELTDRGAIVYERAKALLASIEDFYSEMAELRSHVIGTLRLGVVDNTVTNPALPLHAVIREFLRKNNSARIDITVGSPEQLMVDIVSGQLQLGILPLISQMEGLQVREFETEVHAVYCGRSHPLFETADDTLNVDLISAHPFVVRPYANLRELNGFPGARVGAHASNMEAQAMLILSGQFIGCLPRHYADIWVARGDLRALLPERVVIESPFCLVTRAGRRPSLLVRTFIQELIAQRIESEHADRVRGNCYAASPMRDTAGDDR